MEDILRRALFKIVLSVIYTLVLTMASGAAFKLLRDGGVLGELSGAGDHDGAVQNMLSRPKGLSIDDVGGLEEVKEILRRAVLWPLSHPHLFYGPDVPDSLRPPSGVLLHGPPGTGKTMLARALAAQVGVPLLSLSASNLESKWYGESPRLLKAAFQSARTRLAPCIIFIDEIDGLGRARSEQDQQCVYSLKCELLRNMDGDEQGRSAAVVVIACTNHLYSIDAALRRRFPCTVQVGLPDERARRRILRRLARGTRVAPDALNTIAKRTHGQTGADLAAGFSAACATRLHMTEPLFHKVASASELARKMPSLEARHWPAK